LFLTAFPAAAADLNTFIDAWSVLKYQDTKAPDRLQRGEELERVAAALVAQSPGASEPLFWQGQTYSLMAEIIYSTKSFDKMRLALTAMQQAEKISPDNADIQAELGAYYYHVPGWPLSYGSKAKALEHLQRALALAPEGRDPNYQMAVYLVGEGSKAKAIPYLRRATAPPPPQPGENLNWAKGLAGKAAESLAKVDQ
jgi:tetratricopeptide (TPR) repeat protein